MPRTGGEAMGRTVEVYFYDKPCGVLSENNDGLFTFTYHNSYRGKSISLSMPVSQQVHTHDGLHPFFKGLAPEGWLRKRYSEIQKIDERDLFGLLIRNNQDLLGTISFKEIKHE